MTGSKALDTGIWVAYLRGDPVVRDNVGQIDRLLLPFAVLGELLLGAERSSRPEEQRAQVELLAGACELVPATAGVCGAYARVKAALMSKGRPIPENDIWIAACAIECNVTLVASDRHFREIDGLSLEEW